MHAMSVNKALYKMQRWNWKTFHKCITKVGYMTSFNALLLLEPYTIASIIQHLLSLRVIVQTTDKLSYQEYQFQLPN